MADSAQDRKLPATQRRIEKAREEGQVARSRDLGHFAAITVGVALLAFMAPQIVGWLRQAMVDALRFDAHLVAHPQAVADKFWPLVLQMLAVLLPFCGAMLLVGLGAGLLSGGWNFTMQPLQPKFSKMNPLTGITRLFSGQQLAETLKACLLAVLLAGAGAFYLRQQWVHHAELLAMPLPAALAEGGDLIRGGLFLLCGVLALFALVDVPLQRQMLLRRLRMSLQEVKEEFKQQEGNAEVKGRMKAKMRELANRRMLAAVPQADLVVMNPTHYAVALKYEEGAMAAPKVVAKGADLIAFKIRDLARENKVPVLQAPPLARALYAHCEVDHEVPARLFTAVAQVLAWVYGLRDAMAAGRPHFTPAPTPEIPADLDPHNKAADE